MRIIDLRGQNLSRAELLAAMPRAAMGTSEATDLVRPILDDVKERGAAALRDFEEKFDHVRPKNLRVPVEAIKDALTTLDPEVRAAIEESVRRARAVAANQVPKDFYTDLAEGARVAERWIPIQRVGLYVPGGKAVYPSSVIMNAVPAQAAGVESLAIATPPARDNEEGLPNKTILATCAILGVDEVYAVGGAQAIAMFAYGAKGSEPQDGDILCDPVDKITGPGNIFVATAKSLVSAFVGIDVQESLKYRVPRTEHAERVHTSLSGTQSAIVLTDGLDQSIDAANAYAAEHLEIQTKDADAVVKRIKNAGAIFRGPYSPVPLGDYMSGSNHVLPTGGTARFAAGLGVHTFMKPVEVIEYDEEGLKALAARINAFAVSEDLPAHGECVLSRFVKDPYDKATLREQEKEAGLR